MSYNTYADDLVDKVKLNVNEAYDTLLKVLSSNTPGYDDYTETFIDRLHESIGLLLRIKRSLNV